MKRLTKEMLEEMGVTKVSNVFSFRPDIEINYKRAKISKRGTITVNKLNSPLRAYKGVNKPQRTSIPVGRVVVAWEIGSIEANQVAVYIVNSCCWITMTVSDYQKFRKGLL